MTKITNIISAFTAEQVERLTGLSKRQLLYWDKIGFFPPQYMTGERHAPYSRIYSFKDVVGLRTLNILKNTHRVSLPHLREVAKKLSSYSRTPWADITLMVWKRKVQFDEPETGKTRGVVDGQYALLPIASIVEDLKRDTELLRQRQSSQFGKISKHRFIAHNAPVIAGTRIRVASILRFLEDGYTVQAILKEYPTLKEADIKAAKRHRKAILAA